jgi:uncharacterized protein (TIGR00369 family)
MTDTTTPRPTFDSYDPAVAEMMTTAGGGMGGIPDYLAIRTVEVGPGTMTAELDVRPELLNPFGSAHGGTLAALADHVLGAVLYPLIPRGAWAATTELKLNFLAPIRTGTLRARSEVISLTKRTAVVRIDATNEGRLVGAAQGTVTISAPRAEPASASADAEATGNGDHARE